MTKSNLAVTEERMEGVRVIPSRTDLERGAHGSALGVCIGAEHTTLRGRVLVSWRDATGKGHEAWLPTLQGIHPARGDRVLLTMPTNHGEPVVLGVLDGLGSPSTAPPAEAGPLVKLAPEEALRVASPEGTPILEVRATAEGPEVRLLAPPADLLMPGTFRISAEEIELEARNGEVRIDAAGDVKVTGEVVRLN